MLALMVGKVKMDGKNLPVDQWDMQYPKDILALKIMQSSTVPDNVVMAEIPRYNDTSNVEAKYARMIQKYQMHRDMVF